MGLGIEVIYQCPKSPANVVSNYRIPDPPAYRKGHIHRGILVVRRGYETDSYRSALTSSRGCGKKRELPSGANPTGHRLRPSIGDGPCYDEPSERHGQRGYAFAHENRAFLPFSACSADRYASRHPLLKM